MYMFEFQYIGDYVSAIDRMIIERGSFYRGGAGLWLVIVVCI